MGSVLLKKAIVLVVALESILQQRDQETQNSVVISGSHLKACLKVFVVPNGEKILFFSPDDEIWAKKII